jgi:hypothetical protein
VRARAHFKRTLHLSAGQRDELKSLEDSQRKKKLLSRFHRDHIQLAGTRSTERSTEPGRNRE